MRSYLFGFLYILCCLSIPLRAQDPELFVNNRVLAKVKDKTISTMDVVKQMDLYAFENDPNIAVSSEKKYQFYMQSWRYFLNQLIDNELMIFETEGKDIAVSDGDVREAILERFGPNVPETLDALHLDLEEAKAIVHTDLLSQKVVGYYVHAKAFHSVTPERIREEYEQYLAHHPAHTKWKYQFLTIRAQDESLGKLVAEKAFELVHKKRLSLQEAVDTLAEEEPSVKLTVSREIEGADADIAEQHRTILQSLPINTFSEPVAQSSRSSSNMVFRLFHLSDKKAVEPATFAAMYGDLRNGLLHKLVNEGLDAYAGKLRKKYAISSENNTILIPDTYVPFELR